MLLFSFGNSVIAVSSPTRVINLVYDDSGSMIETDIVDSNGNTVKYDELVDTWCQAKYAIEVFAALLGDNDTLNVYIMSSYSKPKLVLYGNMDVPQKYKQFKMKYYQLILFYVIRSLSE